MPLEHAGQYFDSRLEAVEFAISKMDWLTEADVAQIDVCRATAQQIDLMLEDDDKNIRKAGAYLLRELKTALAALGGSPEARKELGATGESEEDEDELAVKKMQARKKKKE